MLGFSNVRATHELIFSFATVFTNLSLSLSLSIAFQLSKTSGLITADVIFLHSSLFQTLCSFILNSLRSFFTSWGVTELIANLLLMPIKPLFGDQLVPCYKLNTWYLYVEKSCHRDWTWTSQYAVHNVVSAVNYKQMFKLKSSFYLNGFIPQLTPSEWKKVIFQ